MNYIDHVVHYVPSTYLSYDWKFVPFDHLHSVPPPPTPQLLETTNLISSSMSFFFFFNKFELLFDLHNTPFLKKLFIYLWLRWVFVALCGLSLVAASGGYSSLWCVGFSLRWLLLLRSMGCRRAGFSSCGSWALERRLSSCGTWA